MNRELKKYIDECSISIKTKEPNRFAKCLSIKLNEKQAKLRSEFKETEIEYLEIIPEHFRCVILSYFKILKAIHFDKSINNTFYEFFEMINLLIKAAENETNWINRSIIGSLIEIHVIYTIILAKYKEKEKNDDKVKEINEKIASIANKAFKISVNDKNLDIKSSKRTDIYFFSSMLLKIYIKIEKIELARSVDIAVKSMIIQVSELKTIKHPTKDFVSYLYYSAILSLIDADFFSSEKKLEEAFHLIQTYSLKINNQTNQILLIILPLKLHNLNKYLKNDVFWLRYPDLKYLYKDNLFKAIKAGNLAFFEMCQKKFQVIFLKKHIYLLIDMLKQVCYLNLIKKTVSIILSFNIEKKKIHIVPINAFQLSFEFSYFYSKEKDTIDFSNHLYQFSYDEIECILANLIYSGKIRGYLSRSNRCMVFSKTKPFPSNI